MSELPRLLLCSFDVLPGPTGASRRLTEYLRELAEHFNVVVLSAKTPDHSHIEKYQGARLLRVPVGSGDFPARLQAFDRAVRRQLESEEYLVAHFTDPFGGYALCELRESYGFKLVYEADTFPSQELRYTHPQLEGDRRFLARVRRQELFCLMNADRVITGSQVTAGFIRGLGVAPERIEVIRAPVDLAAFTPEAVGPPDGVPLRLVYLGSQVGWQGLPTLLRAMQLAVREVDAHLSIVGPSHTAWQPLLEDLVKELGLEGKVAFRPPVPHAELHQVLAAADVGVVPLDDLERNRVQGGPLAKAAEYLAAGRPVIASDLPLTRELLPEHGTYFHAPGDPEDLGDCLVELAKDPALRVKMGRACREWARQHHDAASTRERLRMLYLELAGLAALPTGTHDQSAASAPTTVGTPTGKIEDLAALRRDADPGTDPEIQPAHLRGTPGSAPREDARTRRRSRRKARDWADSSPGTDPARLGPAAPSPTVAGAAPHSVPPPSSAPPTRPPELPTVKGPGPIASVQPSATAQPADAAGPEAGPEEVHPDEVEALDEGPEEIGAEDLIAEAAGADEPEVETADDAVVEEVEEPPAVQTAEPEPPPSRLDAWFAQLVHGYCPPEGAQFARPTPPTNFPGREGPPPPTVQPPSSGPQSFPTRSGGG